MTSLLIATRNEHKVGEIRAILGGSFQYLTLKDFPGAPAVVEDADTFAGNASKKATELAKWLVTQPSTFNLQPSTPSCILADDSGLEVDALGGAPGVHSARFAALERSDDDPSASPTENSPDAANNAKLLRLLKNVPLEKRTARFRCVIALVEIHPPSSILKSLPAPAPAGLNSRHAGKAALATIRCLCRTVSRSRLPNSVRRRRTSSAIAPKPWHNCAQQ